MTASSPGAERVYDLLLLVYPAAFRARFAGGMREAFRNEYERARAGNLTGVMAFWVATSVDATWFGLAERRTRPAHESGASMRSTFGIDWRDVIRSLRATPIVTAAAVLSVALGIGANTALFSILNGLILKTLPVRDPMRLVVFGGESGGRSWTNPIWEELRARRTQIFEDAFAWSTTRFDLSTHGETDYASGQWASANMFDVLGVRTVIGRTFSEADDARNGGPDGPVAVISYGFWQRRFGGTPDVLGRQLTVNRLPVTIIGVTPEKFLGVDVGRSADITIPINVRALTPNGNRVLDGRSTWWLSMMGRLKPGQTLEQAQSVLKAIEPQVRAATVPTDWSEQDRTRFLTAQQFELTSAATGESNLRRGYQRPLETILVVVGAVLLIASANIANLLLARATARRRELSLRLALGASRWRLARQLLAESLVLSLTGAALGLVIAHWGSALLVRLLETSTNSVTLDLSLDYRVLAFTLAVSLVTAVLFGLAPALGVRGLALYESLKTEGRGVAGDGRFGLKSLFVIGQVAVSLSLVVCAVLFLRTVTALLSAPTGMSTERLLSAIVQAPATVQDNARTMYFERMRQAAEAIPGVSSASLSNLAPMGMAQWNTLIEFDPGMPALTDDEREPWVNAVSPGWFKTYGMSILAGRDVDEHDVAGAPRVLVVNEGFAHRFFPNGTAIGQHVRAGMEGPTINTFEIVGVVSNAVYRSIRSGFEPTVYLPLAQTSLRANVVLTVRSASGVPEGLTRDLGDTIARVDPTAAFTITLIGDQLRSAVNQERLVAVLSGFFGGLALLLAALGLYGVTSYSVARRSPEIGIRMALGANPSGVIRLVMARVGSIVAIGIIIGAALSWWAARFVTALLFGMGPRDPEAFALAALALAFAGLFAGWLPARRAARIDPVRVLHQS